jgi:serine/threonine protein phosphatase PrpC
LDPCAEPQARDDRVPDLRQVAGGSAAVYSRAAPGSAAPNEDRAACWALGPELDLRASILEGFEQANRRVLGLKTGAAATLAVAAVEGRAVRAYHAGDAQVLVVGQRGRVRLQTTPHSPVGYAVEAGVLDQADAIHHDDRHLVSNVVGSTDMSIEVSAPVRLRMRDTIVVASDGLFDNLQVPELVAMVRAGPLAAAARSLAARCYQRMAEPAAGEPSKADDVTFVLFRPFAGTTRAAMRSEGRRRPTETDS